MSIRTPFWESVDSLRQLEATIIAAGLVGITIADLQTATGLSRRTIDRNLMALRELGSGIVNDGSGGRVARRWSLAADQAVFRQGGRAVMSEQREWVYDTLGREYWSLHRGWRVSVHEIHMGWHWAIIRSGVGAGGVESDRAAAEAAAIAEVDRIMGQ